MEILCYCDGSCDYRSKLGGVGVYFVFDNKEMYISKGFKKTTISRMEGMALFMALQSLNKNTPLHVHFFSDSQYITKSFTENRLTKWQMIGWNAIKNVDMWKAILKELALRPLLTYSFTHIGGHQEDLSNPHIFGNAVADLCASYKIHHVYHEDKFT